MNSSKSISPVLVESSYLRIISLSISVPDFKCLVGPWSKGSKKIYPIYQLSSIYLIHDYFRHPMYILYAPKMQECIVFLLIAARILAII